MQLVGLLDSPYVRRVAISMKLRGLNFEHQPLSVFRAFDEFAAINPVVKAPTLVTDDGIVLMDSTLILDHLESLHAPRRGLMPLDRLARVHALRLVGLALAACEKAVQIVYERELRPPERQHAPWLERVGSQLHAACRLVEDEVARRPPMARQQPGITSAVAWTFIQAKIPDVVAPDRYPLWAAFTQAAERLPEFASTPPA